jgi:ATP-dependent DNA helicase PIF1
MQVGKHRIKQEKDAVKTEFEPDFKRVKLETPAIDSLDEKQKEILDLCLTGRNVYLTGVGGTGKTFLLHQITSALRKKHGKDKVVVTASTGVAALQACGQTLHSLAGAGVPDVVADFEKCRKLRDGWRKMAVLIIDEVSLLEAAYIDYLDAMVREIRHCPDKAFGGLQLIWVADFLQLKGISSGVSLASRCPVVSNFKSDKIPVHVRQFDAYAFQTMAFRDAKFVVAELKTIFRQSEVVMIEALMKIRRGVVDDSVRAFVASCAQELPSDDGIMPTVLYALNKNVEMVNQSKLDALPSKEEVYVARDSVHCDIGSPPWTREKLLRDPFFKSGPASDRMVLKVGAQVILTQNLDRVLVNGSRGVVKHFETKEKAIEDLTVRIGLCKDDTLRAVLLGQLDVLRTSPQETAYPVVLFRDGCEALCYCVEFSQRVWNAGYCKRYQVPLKLAWSLSVHRSQGSSLDKVQVDLTGCFAVGQTYVALSRARTTSGLQILGFTESAIKADPMAIAFHDALSAGKLDEFMATVPLWFQPVLQPGIDPNWRALFESSKVFKGWVERGSK